MLHLRVCVLLSGPQKVNASLLVARAANTPVKAKHGFTTSTPQTCSQAAMRPDMMSSLAVTVPPLSLSKKLKTAFPN